MMATWLIILLAIVAIAAITLLADRLYKNQSGPDAKEIPLSCLAIVLFFAGAIGLLAFLTWPIWGR